MAFPTSGMLRRDMSFEEREDLLPALQHRLGHESASLVIEKSVADAVVAWELVSLAELLQHRLGTVDLIGSGIGVVVAEQADQRNREIPGEVDRRHRPLVLQLFCSVRK